MWHSLPCNYIYTAHFDRQCQDNPLDSLSDVRVFLIFTVDTSITHSKRTNAEYYLSAISPCSCTCISRDLYELLCLRRKRRRQRQRKRHLNYNFILSVLLRDYFNFFILYKNDELPRNQIGRNGVQVKKENEKFIVVCSRSPQILNLVISRCCFSEDGKEIYQTLKRTWRVIENVTWKCNFILFVLLRGYFSSFILYKNDELPRTEFVGMAFKWRKRMKNSSSCAHVLPKSWIWSFHVAVLPRTAKKYNQTVAGDCFSH